jgi:DNA-binding FadR family transcriptional regulator
MEGCPTRRRRMLITATAQTITENVIGQILALIRNGTWKPGDALPSEKELTRSLGVSRPSVREALQSVAFLGLVELHAGRRARVKAPSFRTMFDPAGMAALLQREDLVYLLEARLAIEVAAARLAAQRIDRAGLEGLERTVRDLSAHMLKRDVLRYVEADLAFHQCLIQATGNPIFIEVYEVIRRGIRASLRLTSSTPGGMRYGHGEHRAIFEAVQSGDPHQAEQTMRAHLGEVHKYLEAFALQSPDPLKGPAKRRRARPPGSTRRRSE